MFATKVQFMSNSGLRTKSQLFLLLSLFVCLLCGCETREGRQVTGRTADILRNFPRPQRGDSFKAVADSTGRRRTDLKAAGLHGEKLQLNFNRTSSEGVSLWGWGACVCGGGGGGLVVMGREEQEEGICGPDNAVTSAAKNACARGEKESGESGGGGGRGALTPPLILDPRSLRRVQRPSGETSPRSSSNNIAAADLSEAASRFTDASVVFWRPRCVARGCPRVSAECAAVPQ